MANEQNTYPAAERWMSITESAKYLSVTRQTLTRWSEEFPERLPRFRPFEGSRAIRYRISDLDAFMRPDGPSEARDSAIEAVA